DATAHSGCYVHDIRVDRRIVGRGMSFISVVRIESRRNGDYYDHHGDGLATRGALVLAGCFHIPNQSAQTMIATVRPAEAHTSSCIGTNCARPVATMTARAMMAIRIPMPASNIQAGKYAPNKMKDGAPREAQPLIASALVRIGTTAARPLICIMDA